MPPIDEWPALLAETMPTDVDAIAFETGAIRRRREIRSGTVFLRLLLAWVVGHMSLRGVAVWASENGVCELSDEALRKRFARCEAFLRRLLQDLLNDWIVVPPSRGRALRIVDASMCPFVGPSGRSLRVHAVFDPIEARLTSADVTSDVVGESLSHAPHGPRDLTVADRGLAHVAKLLEVDAKGTAFLVRAHLPSVPMRDAHGAVIRPQDVLDAARDGLREMQVWLVSGKERLPARLAIVPMDAARAKKAREKLRQRARKKGRRVCALTLRLAGFWCLLTNLSCQEADVDTLCAIYRLRWQIELFFKRCKSLLGLRTPPHAGEQLAKVGVLASLLAAALVERSIHGHTVANDTPEDDRTARSLWRMFHRDLLDLVVAIVHVAPRRQRRLQRARANARLRERSRRRRYALDDWITRGALGPPSGASN